ncbi:HU family DNA-binding protein [Patescibacteria group bacterium]|nr:HU family DNA-binding protein [Patescibacteria group bacterium]MBU1673371.1 HU family DNA-binding protein [Patescibacteria group bacterium]MBU1963409.1 HU family DNA-binding protein [Patescibacteria group bacterium]
MAKMTKSQIMTALSEESGMSKKEMIEFWEKFMALVYRETKENGEFTLPGLGKVVKQHRKARKGRNPMTGEEIDIPAKIVLKFRIAKAAKDEIL